MSVNWSYKVISPKSMFEKRTYSDDCNHESDANKDPAGPLEPWFATIDVPAPAPTPACRVGIGAQAESIGDPFPQTTG